jgi:hypothetical protein
LNFVPGPAGGAFAVGSALRFGPVRLRLCSF